ncbi:MAG: recombinase family protein [Bacteroidetes bacterium]|nr:recombinase family protein [Bacteroidota bacterium]
MKKAVVYARVSRRPQTHSGLSLTAQRMAVETYARFAGFTIINEFIEIESGEHNNRIQMRKALRCCQWNDATLLIAKIDRLTRNVHFVTILETSKVKFVAVDNPDANWLVIHILVAVAQYEREMICKRTKDALAVKKEQGIELGTYGKYVLSVKNKRQADIRAYRLKPLIIELIGKGHSSIRKLAAAFNDRGIKTPSGKEYQKTTMYNVLKRVNIRTPRSKERPI